MQWRVRFRASEIRPATVGEVRSGFAYPALHRIVFNIYDPDTTQHLHEHEWLRSEACPVWKRSAVNAFTELSRRSFLVAYLVAPLTTTCIVESAVAGLDEWMPQLGQ